MKKTKEYRVITVIVLIVHLIGMLVLWLVGSFGDGNKCGVITIVVLNVAMSIVMFFIPARFKKIGKRIKRINRQFVRFLVFIFGNCILYGGITSLIIGQEKHEIIFFIRALIYCLPVLWMLFALFFDSGKFSLFEDLTQEEQSE
ncbi:MAG: hypothetical protein K5655_00695 [Lachnospiraceae bacterium]|nr:hypothetical protein [Lachnospiraceae bacterium]